MLLALLYKAVVEFHLHMAYLRAIEVECNVGCLILLYNNILRATYLYGLRFRREVIASIGISSGIKPIAILRFK